MRGDWLPRIHAGFESRQRHTLSSEGNTPPRATSGAFLVSPCAVSASRRRIRLGQRRLYEVSRREDLDGSRCFFRFILPPDQAATAARLTSSREPTAAATFSNVSSVGL